MSVAGARPLVRSRLQPRRCRSRRARFRPRLGLADGQDDTAVGKRRARASHMCAFRQTKCTRPWPKAAQEVAIRSPRCQRSGMRRHVADEPDAAHDRRRLGDRAAARLVVERDVHGDDGDCRATPPRARSLRSPARAPADLRLLGVAEVQAVGERKRLAAGAGDVQRGVPLPRASGFERVAAAEWRPVERRPRLPREPSMRSTAAIEPGPSYGARADDLVVLLEHPRLRLVVHRSDRCWLTDAFACLEPNSADTRP